MIPVVGLGTNQYGSTDPEAMAPIRQVLRRMAELGGKVVDTAPSYGRGASEEVIGTLVEELGIRDQLFLATKVTAPDGNVEEGLRQLNESFRKLRTDTIDLMQVHNLRGTDAIMPVLREWKQEGRIRYLGVTTSSTRQHGALMETMRAYPLDFIQVNYSLGSRGAADEVLPLARDRGQAVLLNIPFGGRRRSLFATVSGRELPDLAREVGADSWAQLFLKYLISHPAVTCPIPGTDDVVHLEDNMGAMRAPLPDQAWRRRVEEYWDGLD
jgi:aryl-alcohol dehydrogenase-like predicted oxidoreductase